MAIKNIKISLAATLPNHKVPFANMRVEVGAEYEFVGGEKQVDAVEDLRVHVWTLFKAEAKKARELMDR